MRELARQLASSLLFGTAFYLNVRASRDSGRVFTGDIEESGGQIFSPKTIPWLPSFPLLARIRRGALDGPNPLASHSSAPHDEAVNRRSILLSFVIPVSSAVLRVRNEQAHEQEIRVCAGYSSPFVVKTKISVDIFQRIPLKGQFTSGPPRE